MTTPNTIARIRRSVESYSYPFYPFLLVRDWVHEARNGTIRLPRRMTLLTHEAYRRRERNAFQIGRDYQHGLDRDTVAPLTAALRRKGA
jgi:hypothetical protein